MIQKLFDSYEDSKYYIDTNKKKLAYDNLSVISIMLTFFIVVSVLFLAVALAFGKGLTPYINYLPAVIILILVAFINKIVAGKIKPFFLLVRIYAAFIYSIIIISFSMADIVIYNQSRAVFFPAAIVAICSLYIDTMGVMTIYKIVLSIIFLFIDYHYKTLNIVVNDAVVSLLAIIISNFCYAAIVNATLSRREDTKQLEYKSKTDLLTGLVNKVTFEQMCKEYLNKKMNGAKCTMFFFDLDNFKHVNDTYGHETGDKVLEQFANILQSYFHPDDIIGRIGGDEFMVLVLGEMPESYSETRCRNILHELRIGKYNEAAGITCSIGVVEATDNYTFEELYKITDDALYEAKRYGKDRYNIVKV